MTYREESLEDLESKNSRANFAESEAADLLGIRNIRTIDIF